MRDPWAPIPHPELQSSFWNAARAPRPVAGGGEITYDPTRLIHGHAPEDHLGIDRRTADRGMIDAEDMDLLELEPMDEPAEGGGATNLAPALAPDPRRCVVAGAHRRFDALVGLETHAGWAIVRTISFSPNGVLVRVIDPCDPGIEGALRGRVRATIARLAADIDPIADGTRRGSMLATVGACLLGPRVVADLSRWTHTGSSGQPPSSRTRTRPHLEVKIVVPPPTPAGGRSYLAIDPRLGPDRPAAGTRFPAVVSPLNDPNDTVLALAMRPEDLRAFETRLRGPRRGPRTAWPRED